MPQIKLIVDGGSMKPGPTVAQQLGPLGINLGKLIEDTNQATSGFKGMKVPVIIDVDGKTKKYTIIVSSPPVSELIKKEINVEAGSSQAGKVYIGNIAIEQTIQIAKTKMSNMLAKNLKSAVKLVVGSCVSSGVLVENKNAKEIILDIDSGKYDKEISQEKIQVSPEKRKELDSYFEFTKTQQEARAKAEQAAKEAVEAAKAAETTATPIATTSTTLTATPATGSKSPAGKIATSVKAEKKK